MNLSSVGLSDYYIKNHQFIDKARGTKILFYLKIKTKILFVYILALCKATVERMLQL